MDRARYGQLADVNDKPIRKHSGEWRRKQRRLLTRNKCFWLTVNAHIWRKYDRCMHADVCECTCTCTHKDPQTHRCESLCVPKGWAQKDEGCEKPGVINHFHHTSALTPLTLICPTTISNTAKKGDMSGPTYHHVSTRANQVQMRCNYRLNGSIICHSVLAAWVNPTKLHRERFEVS